VQGYEIELEQIDRQLLSLDREQKDLLHNALRGFPESLIISENKKLNTERESLTKRKSELEVRIKNSKEAVINLPKLEEFIERIRTGITELDYEGKRLALDMLDIKVWLDGSDVEITGAIDLDRDVIVTAHS
jgi:hypothetical protein